MANENPYLVMDAKVLDEHLAQVKEVMETKKLNIIQYFGESISEENQTKITEHASLTTQVTDLEAAVETAKTSNDLSPDTEKLAKLNMNSVIAEIKAIDDTYPIQGIVDSSLNAFEKIDMLGQAKTMVTYSQKAIDAIKSEVGTGKKVQGFGEAPQTSDDDLDKNVEALIEQSGVKITN